MNQDRIEGRWKQLLGKIREYWGRLTDDDMDVIAGRRNQLLGRIQQRDGLAREQSSQPDQRSGRCLAALFLGFCADTFHAPANGCRAGQTRMAK